MFFLILKSAQKTGNLKIYSSCADEDHVIWLKAPEQLVKLATRSWWDFFFFNSCFQAQELTLNQIFFLNSNKLVIKKKKKHNKRNKYCILISSIKSTFILHNVMLICEIYIHWQHVNNLGCKKTALLNVYLKFAGHPWDSIKSGWSCYLDKTKSIKVILAKQNNKIIL